MVPSNKPQSAAVSTEAMPWLSHATVGLHKSQQRGCWDSQTFLQGPTLCLRNSRLQPILQQVYKGLKTLLLLPVTSKLPYFLSSISHWRAETCHIPTDSSSGYRTNRRSLSTGLPVPLPGPPTEASTPSDPGGNHSSTWLLSLLAWPTHLLVYGGPSSQSI